MPRAWAVQIFGYDALTLLATVGTRVPGIELGTGVVPVYSRHPQVMAQQALTVQAATGGRLVLGIGLSHQVVVEGLWGLSYDRPARYLREYLSALVPMLEGEVVSVTGRGGHGRHLRAALEIPTVASAGAGGGPRADHARAGRTAWPTAPSPG